MNTILKLRGLNKIYHGGVRAVKNVDMTIQRGEIFAFLGPNGAGKSTTQRMICGLCRPSSGSIILNGSVIDNRHSDYLKRIGFVSQHFNLDNDLTGMENMLIHSYLYRITNKMAKRRILELLEYTDLFDIKDTLVSQYSGGMKRKLQIMRAIIHDPEFLMFDEPTVGLDPHSRENIWNLIKKLNEKGKTVFFTTHYMEEAQKFAHRLAIINKGSLIKVGEPQSIINELGQWCVEIYSNGKTLRNFYRRREEAELDRKNNYQQITVRRTRLEDVFINLTKDIQE